MCLCVEICFYFYWDVFTHITVKTPIYLRRWLLWWSRCLTLVTTKLFSKVAIIFYVLPAMYRGFSFFVSLPTLGIMKIFYYGHPHGCKVESRCGFDLRFPEGYWCWVCFHVLTCHLYIFLGEVSFLFFFILNYKRSFDFDSLNRLGIWGRMNVYNNVILVRCKCIHIKEFSFCYL